jgi:hypothetical protein
VSLWIDDAIVTLMEEVMIGCINNGMVGWLGMKQRMIGWI